MKQSFNINPHLHLYLQNIKTMPSKFAQHLFDHLPISLKPSLFFTALLLSALPLVAQNFVPSSFSTPIIISEGTQYADQVKAADMDGDGQDDVIAMSSIGSLVWFKTDAGGNVTEKQVIKPDGYSRLMLADWDKDQDIDVLYNHAQDSFYWQANDGSGQFGPEQPLFPTTQLKSSIALADLNTDGFADLVLIVEGADSLTLQWYPGDGTGHVSAPKNIVYEDNDMLSFNPFVMDLDGDGDPDLAGYVSQTEIARFLNDGAGNFSSPEVIISQPNLYPTKLTAIDFDGDGDLDIYPDYLANFIGRVYFPNDGAGNFGPAVPFIFDGLTPDAPFTLADFSGDGLVDMLIGTPVYDLLLFTNNGAGNTFSKNVFAGYRYAANQNLNAADIDGDGDLDVLLVRNFRLMWMRNEGGGNFAPFDNFYPEIEASTIANADLDSDGLTDYIVGDHTTGIVAWFRNNGNGTFGKRQPIVFQVNDVEIVVPSDLDGDGDVDILTKADYGEIKSFFNDGDENFTLGQTIKDGDDVYSIPIYAIDMNNDQHPDVITVHNLYYNDGTGQLDSIKPLGLTFPFRPADLDHDGDIDILAGQGHYWIENDGYGVFSINPTQLPSLQDVDLAQAQVFDFDGDSIPEVIASSSNLDWSGLRKIKNIISGGPIEMDTLANNTQPGMLSADVDADGDRDLFIRNYFGNWSSLWWNDGHGKFDNRSNFIPQNGQISPVDFDNDGLPDLQIVAYNENKIGWMRNFSQDFYLKGACFWDKNENGIRDAGEEPLQNIGVTLPYTGQVSYSNESGAFRFFVDPAANHLVQFATNLCWMYSSDSALLMLPPTANGYPNLELGFKKIADTTAVSLDISSAPTRCATDVPFWISLQNIGCQDASGRFYIVTDSLTVFQSASPAPDQISAGVAGQDTLWWHFDSLQPTQIRLFNLVFLMPDANHVGENIRLRGFSFLKNAQQGFDLVDSSAYVSEIRCAYDPNDKLVSRVELPSDYEPSASELLYTIRFQNTGNDTAQVVRIRDTLDYYLDIHTFKPLGSSHPYRCELNWNGPVAEFIFENISLPDSNVNEPASHGFVSFSIQPQAGLAPGGIIPNRADIYFDNNPAIGTNWVETVVQTPVSVRPVPLPAWLVSISPNPNGGVFVVDLPQPAAPGMILRILDRTGRLVLERQVAAGSNRQTVQAGDLPAGLYFLQIVVERKVMGVGKFVKQ